MRSSSSASTAAPMTPVRLSIWATGRVFPAAASENQATRFETLRSGEAPSMWKRSKKSRWSDPLTAVTVFGGSGIGVVLMYFFDPQNGKRRRHGVRDRTLAFFRRIGRGIARLGRRQQSYAYGLSQHALHLRERDKPDMDDVTLT